VIYWLTCPAAECPALTIGASPPDFLSASERDIYAGLTFPKRRREWVLGRWTAKRLLRRSVTAYRSTPLSAITVGSDPDGAPFFFLDGVGRLPLCLSISHRRERGFCALSPSTASPIGADIERVEPRDPAFVRDFFTAQEADRVFGCPPPLRDMLVTVIWSAKESALKALRQGLRVDTRRVEIDRVAGIEADDIPPSLNLKPETWLQLHISCSLSDTGPFLGWWRPDGDDVLTIASHLIFK
jgi:4'-phosphopantetheinyl transferase